MRISSRALWPAAYIAGYFLLVGLLLWAASRAVSQLVFFGAMAPATGLGFLIHARVARKSRRRWGRTLSVVVIGLGLFLGAGVFGRQSFQLEGFFFYLLAGAWGGVIVHYLVAKLVGPALIGRAFCGWGCWNWMVFDLLPFRRSPGRFARMPDLRLWHLGASFILVASLTLAGYDHGFTWQRTDGLWWYLGGCAAYWLAGLTLAVVLRDNRAFCKYLCPVSVLVRTASRASVLRIGADAEACNACGACEKVCPMDVKIVSWVKAGRRVDDPECVLCQTCTTACPKDCLGLTLGLPSFRPAPTMG